MTAIASANVRFISHVTDQVFNLLHLCSQRAPSLGFLATLFAPTNRTSRLLTATLDSRKLYLNGLPVTARTKVCRKKRMPEVLNTSEHSLEPSNSVRPCLSSRGKKYRIATSNGSGYDDPFQKGNPAESSKST
jgi:hypothetical protein